MNWREVWHRISTTRYTMLLEDEVDRLRTENRGLLNSLLTRAGVQPIDQPPLVSREGRRMTRYQRQADIDRKAYKDAWTRLEADARGAASKPQDAH